MQRYRLYKDMPLMTRYRLYDMPLMTNGLLQGVQMSGKHHHKSLCMYGIIPSHFGNK